MIEEKHRLHIAPVPPGRPTAQMRCSREFAGNEQGYRSGSSARGLFTSGRCNFLLKAIDLLEAPQAIVLMTQPGTHKRSNKATALRCFKSTSIQRKGWYCFGSQHFDQMTTTKR